MKLKRRAKEGSGFALKIYPGLGSQARRNREPSVANTPISELKSPEMFGRACHCSFSLQKPGATLNIRWYRHRRQSPGTTGCRRLDFKPAT
jgi:hypothetical protein